VLERALARWLATVAPFTGAKVVVHDTLWAYILTPFGLVQVGTVEERPGMPPAPAHLAKLIPLMKDDKVKVIIVQAWSDVKLSDKGADTYPDAIDANVRTLAQALQ
jgi:ABC-type Zn uptake system ZnuABC Zn-binding protein ZnuA